MGVIKGWALTSNLFNIYNSSILRQRGWLNVFFFLISVQNFKNISYAKDIVNNRYTNETAWHPKKWIKEGMGKV